MDSQQEGLELLLNEGINASRFLLEKNGEMFPIAMTLAADNKIDYIAVPFENEQPNSQELIDEYVKVLSISKDMNEFVATLIAYDIRLIESIEGFTDALALELEHKEGLTMKIIVPYKLAKSSLEIGTLVKENLEPKIFSNN